MMGRGRAREEETGSNSNMTPTINSIDQTESQIIVSLDGSSDVIECRLPSGVRRGRRRGRGMVRRRLGGRRRRWGRRPSRGALEAIEGQEIEELTDVLDDLIQIRCKLAPNETHRVLQIDQIEPILLDVTRVAAIVPTRLASLLPRRNGSTVVVSLGVGRPESDRRGGSGSSWGADEEDGDSGEDGGESEEAHLCLTVD
jgi:hypothetical protein